MPEPVRKPLQSVSLIVIGDEILDGRITDANLVFFSRWLAERGLWVSKAWFLRDDAAVIAATIGEALALPHNGVLCCGGLGPTDDDKTTAAVAAALGRELALDAAELAVLEQKFRSFGMPMVETNLKQVYFPEGAAVLPNWQGTAPGHASLAGTGFVAAVPGVPRENQAMAEALEAWMRGHFEFSATRAVVQLRAYGLTESRLAQAMQPILEQHPQVEFHDRFSFPEIEIRLAGPDRALVRLAAEDTLASLPAVYAEGERTLARVLLDALKNRGLRLAVAESCTGGMLGSLLTAQSGSSAVFLGGVQAYANAVKQKVLGVDAQILNTEGAVSEPCALAMADGVRKLTGADVGISITGIAGPDGGTEDKPVGTTWIAVSTAADSAVRLHKLRWDRERNRVAACWAAMAQALQVIEGRVRDPQLG